MSEKDFQLAIICNQNESREVINGLKEVGIRFEIMEKRGFAPSSPEVAINILVSLAELLTLIVALMNMLGNKKAYIDFESRHRLARKMLADLGPLYWTKGEDTPEYSYYEFKTPKCKHYWELDKGKIRHGPLRCS